MSSTIDVSTIIAALGGNPSTGKGRCPAHDDKNPSLQVTEGSNGKPLFKCFAGCTQQDVLEALRQRGLWSGGAPISGQFLRKNRNDGKPTRDVSDGYWRFRNAIAVIRAAAGAKAEEGPPRGLSKGPRN